MADHRLARSPIRPAVAVVVLIALALSALLTRFGDRQQPSGDAPQTVQRSTQQTRAAASANAIDERDSVTDRARPASPNAAPPQRKTSKLGKLRQLDGNVLESTAGLQYGPGSREGHRLKHVLLHTKDQPTRPGSHGVFLNGRDGALAVIDEAYLAARRGGRAVRVQREGDRTVYTVDLRRKIGYVGGQEGQRRDHPPATHVRIVLAGNRVITAFPLIP